MDAMTLERKLELLISLAGDDRDGAPGREAPALPPRLRNANGAGALRALNIRDLRVPGRGRVSLLRILMTNACSFNCHYCPMRRDREMPRTLLKPEELVRIFLGNMTEFDLLNSFHLHGNIFRYYKTGTTSQYELTDTVALCQGERGIIEFRYKHAGPFMFHAHQSEFAELGWSGTFNVREVLNA